MWRDRTNLYSTTAPLCHSVSELTTACALPSSYISYRQSYAHHPTKKTRYGPGSGVGGGSNGGFGASSDGFGRSSALPGSEDTQGLLSGADYLDDGDAVIEMDLLPPRWADISDEVTEHLEKIAKQSHALERLHQKHVLPGFNDDEAKRAEEDEIDRLTRSITRAFHDCHKCIQAVGQMVKESRSSAQGMTSAEETMANNIQVSLAAKVQEASAGFRKKQSAYLKSTCDFSHCKWRPPASYAITNLY